jgi:hypothetical protein
MSLDPVECRILIPTVPVLGRLHTITSLMCGALRMVVQEEFNAISKTVNHEICGGPVRHPRGFMKNNYLNRATAGNLRQVEG